MTQVLVTILQGKNSNNWERCYFYSFFASIMSLIISFLSKIGTSFAFLLSAGFINLNHPMGYIGCSYTL